MTDPSNPQFWSMRLGSHPQHDDVSFDLDTVLSSVVSLRAAIPEDAFTAPILGTEREGQGVVIDNSGTVLTIGYLVTEAEEIWQVVIYRFQDVDRHNHITVDLLFAGNCLLDVKRADTAKRAVEAE